MTARIEHDLLGDETLPESAWYGIQTLRALRNFNITGVPIHHFSDLINTLTMVKEAAAEANYELGLLDCKKIKAIRQACQRIRDGELHDQFVVDLIQGGAGTSTNMNANEVIANLALITMGHQKGEYQYLHPNNDINKSQSTNDAYPTAARLAIVLSTQALVHSLNSIQKSLDQKADEFADILKMGRTQLQDAVPMTLGQEFKAFSVTLGEDIERIKEACTLLCEVNLGGTAIGTGLNTQRSYAAIAIEHLSRLSGLPVKSATHLIEATSDMGAFVTISSIQKRLAIKLSKICNDLRLLSSGPRAGLNEINLPAMQPGSSIMPGKINPVIPEAVNQTAFQVIGHDLTVTMAAEAGQLQLNAMEPVIVYNILNSMKMLSSAIYMLDHRCIRGITANKAHCHNQVKDSIGMITALVPYIGYDNASRIAKHALVSRSTVGEIILKEKLLDEATLNHLMSPANMTGPMEAAL
ncbi:aspartate ammonia-lyase [Neptunomonas concharum]|uniref:Aspartate ammonia-lyase n=1 Tax=Neptunomonas concharum TaxID=1031538 RepID=A0A5P1REY2_9GAMM|nr:aspartate ammonia-lyase [Neptunomonas concharum]QEQ97831.1 aspartate ammonia-lyase [Neptunomonas concharum]